LRAAAAHSHGDKNGYPAETSAALDGEGRQDCSFRHYIDTMAIAEARRPMSGPPFPRLSVDLALSSDKVPYRF
jgi:hypothetical protein